MVANHIKKKSAIIIVLMFISCSNYFINSKGAIRPKKARFSLSIIKEQDHIDEIDTMTLYELIYRWNGKKDFDLSTNSSLFRIDNYRNYDGSKLNSKEYLRFYDSGRTSFFNISKETTITRNTLNPENGNIGVYTIHDGNILIERFVGIGHDGMYLKSRAKLIGDSLYIIEKTLNNYIHKIYVPKKISKESFDWEARW
ncbi:hypothetical protein L0P88_08850 [Muricauda sp. SCSIO 64092]|uniref:hypothetical protein n=1 Tax=Allomuricauda sp. SCSIO 64092 TaxID=2908842 RepID=UPI001FF265E6|nr:hypothetical protein [Muricauda sp. SCSIO 64092]UOY08647.1 hypothetical protein L0P88_08850 [Muricauda sp. SCSIO 64092]